MDGSPLTHMVVQGHHTVIQEQGRFPKHELPWMIPPVCERGISIVQVLLTTEN